MPTADNSKFDPTEQAAEKAARIGRSVVTRLLANDPDERGIFLDAWQAFHFARIALDTDSTIHEIRLEHGVVPVDFIFEKWLS